MRFSATVLCLSTVFSVYAQRTVNLFTAIDIGRMEKGSDRTISLTDTTFDPNGIALNRTYVDVNVAQQLDEHNFISVGVGGIFWKAFEQSESDPDGKVIHFGPGVSNAFLRYTFNDQWNLTTGYFPYKYNQSARNLGEYLFRSEAYPTVIFTGGWGWLNSANYNPVGFKLTRQSETLTQDLGLFGEYFNAPIYDLTPTYVATWRPTAGFTLGGGIAFHRFINPDTRIRKQLTREYTYYENFYLPQFDSSSNYPRTIPAHREKVILKDDINNLEGNYYLMSYDSIAKLPENAASLPKTVRFDNRAIMLMAHASLDFNGLLGLDPERMGAFELYGEAALLGIKNYPIFYTKYTQRLPIMLGACIPTLGFLNTLNVEMEYLNNPNIESLQSTFDVLDLPPDPGFRFRDFEYKTYNRDNFKWSMYASKNLTGFLTLFVQVANDHMRLKDKYARPEFIPVTNTPTDWYWLARIQWAI